MWANKVMVSIPVSISMLSDTRFYIYLNLCGYLYLCLAIPFVPL